MPNVTLKDGTKKSFPYTEVGIANAKQFAKTNGVKMKSNYHPPSAPFSKKKRQEERNKNVQNLIPKADTDARPRRGAGSLAEKKSLEKEGHGDQGMYGYSYGSKKDGDSSRWGIGTSPWTTYRNKTTPGGSLLMIPETDPVPKKAKKRTYLMADGKLQADDPNKGKKKVTRVKAPSYMDMKKAGFPEKPYIVGESKKEKPPSAPKKVKVSKRDKARAEYEIPKESRWGYPLTAKHEFSSRGHKVEKGDPIHGGGFIPDIVTGGKPTREFFSDLADSADKMYYPYYKWKVKQKKKKDEIAKLRASKLKQKK